MLVHSLIEMRLRDWLKGLECWVLFTFQSQLLVLIYKVLGRWCLGHLSHHPVHVLDHPVDLLLIWNELCVEPRFLVLLDSLLCGEDRLDLFSIQWESCLKLLLSRLADDALILCCHLSLDVSQDLLGLINFTQTCVPQIEQVLRCLGNLVMFAGVLLAVEEQWPLQVVCLALLLLENHLLSW